MSSWNRRTCCHGVTEGLDYHDCVKCKQIAISQGKEWVDYRQTYLYTRKPKEKVNA